MFQFPGQGKPAQGILYDSDFGRTIDSVLALALLHGLENKREARIAALSINEPSLKAAQLCDVIEKFYASATTGPAAQFFQGLPIGLGGSGAAPNSDTPIRTIPLAKLDENGKLVYSPRISKINDTAEPALLLRNALTAQYDGNAAVVLAGPASNLTALLDLSGGKELIEQKVKVLVIAGTALPGAGRLFSEWPTPIVMTSAAVRDSVRFPGSAIETDFAYAANHPVADAYRAFEPMPYDAPTGDMAAMMYAVRPREDYFELSQAGTMTAGENGAIVFKAGEGGKHRWLLPGASLPEKITKLYTELASAKPVPRVRRPIQVDDAEEKKDLPEKAPVSKSH